MNQANTMDETSTSPRSHNIAMLCPIEIPIFFYCEAVLIKELTRTLTIIFKRLFIFLTICSVMIYI